MVHSNIDRHLFLFPRQGLAYHFLHCSEIPPAEHQFAIPKAVETLEIRVTWKPLLLQRFRFTKDRHRLLYVARLVQSVPQNCPVRYAESVITTFVCPFNALLCVSQGLLHFA